MKQKLKKGDKVVMHSCMEAEAHNGKIWICQDDQFTSRYNEQEVIFLEGFAGYFSVSYLQKVNIEPVLVLKKPEGFELAYMEASSSAYKCSTTVCAKRTAGICDNGKCFLDKTE
jgi:hypothetical protein